MSSVAESVFQGIGGSIDNALDTFVTSISAQLIYGITPWAINGVALYFILYGYFLTLGVVQQSFSDFLIKCVKIFAIGELALNTEMYLTWVVEGIYSLEEALTATLSNSPMGTTLYASLDSILQEGWSVILECWQLGQSAGWMHIGVMLGWYINAALLLAGFGLVIVSGGVSILISHAMIKVAFAAGPLFIVCMIWPMTARFFDSWLHFVLNHILVVVFTSMVLSLSVRVYGDAFSQLKLNDESLNFTQASLELLIIAIALYGLTRAMAGMAMRLAGGFSSELQLAHRITRTVTQGAISTTSKIGGMGLHLLRSGAAKFFNRSTSTPLGQNLSGGVAPSSKGPAVVPRPAYRQATLDYLQNRPDYYRSMELGTVFPQI